MSIAQKQPKGTLTEPSRALTLFTDRADAVRLFAERVHAVRALCAARSFDWDVYSHLARELHFAATEPAFDAYG